MLKLSNFKKIYLLVIIFFVMNVTLSYSYKDIEEIKKEFPGASSIESIKIEEDKNPPILNVLEMLPDKEAAFRLRQLYQLLQNPYTDNLYYKIAENIMKIEDKISSLCKPDLSSRNPGIILPGISPGIILAAEAQACQSVVSTFYPGSQYNNLSGGVVVAKNTTFYLTPYPPKVTKIVMNADYTLNAIPAGDAYTVTISVPGSNQYAQFTLKADGISDIQNISSIYDIQRDFQNQNVKISAKEIVIALLDYFKHLKKTRNINSDTFILNMLTSIKAQQDFIEYYMKKK